jgi:hypothetical protein
MVGSLSRRQKLARGSFAKASELESLLRLCLNAHTPQALIKSKPTGFGQKQTKPSFLSPSLEQHHFHGTFAPFVEPILLRNLDMHTWIE